MRKYFLHRREVIAMALLFVGGAFLATVYGVKLVPVVIQMEAKHSTVNESSVIMRVYGRKVRNCKYLDAVGYVRRSGHSEYEEAAIFDYPDDTSPGNSKPRGKFDFGWWRWVALGAEDIEQVMTVSTHTCGDSIVSTKIGPFKV